MRSIRVFVIGLLVILAIAACSATNPPAPTAFEDCFNRSVLYRTEHGCYEGD